MIPTGFNSGAGLQQGGSGPEIQSLPSFITYDAAQAPRLRATTRTIRITPVGGNPNGAYGNKVSIPVKSKLFLDPWSTRLKVTVDFLNPVPCPGLQDATFGQGSQNVNIRNRVNQLDGNALSLIEQFTWTNKQQFEIERVANHDIIARLLSDVVYGPFVRFCKTYEGNGGILQSGFGQFHTSIPPTFHDTILTNMGFDFITALSANTGYKIGMDGIPNSTTLTVANGGLDSWEKYFTTISGQPNVLNTDFQNAELTYVNQRTGIQELQMVISSPVFWQPCADLTRVLTNTAGISGLFSRGPQYGNQIPLNMMKLNSTLAPQRFFYDKFSPLKSFSAASIGSTAVYYNNPEKFYQLCNDIYNGLQTDGSLNPSGVSSWTPAQLYQFASICSPTDVYGFQNPFRSDFASSGMEPMFSLFPQMQMMNGSPTFAPITSATYTIPLLSGAFGIVMPEQKLVPLAGYDDLVLDIKFSDYAFFTSTFLSKQTSERKPNITKVELWMDVVEIENQEVKQALNMTLQTGIVLRTVSWWNCFQQTFQTMPAEININQGFNSLKSIVFMIYDQDYINCSAARKHFRHSQSITSFQIKLGNQMFPVEPILGNAGCNTGAINNYDFIFNLLKIFGNHLTAWPTAITPGNFAVDYRDWDWQLVSSTMAATDQMHPQWHLPFMCENQVIGKACFGYDFDSVNFDRSVQTGINTFELKPFTALFGTNQNTYYQKSNPYFNQAGYTQTSSSKMLEIYAFGLYDLSIVISPVSMSVEGVL